MALIRRMNPMPAQPPRSGPTPTPSEAGTGSVAVADRDQSKPVEAPFDPPPVSDWYRSRADYLKVNQFDHSVSQKAFAGHRRWQDRLAGAQVEITAWLAEAGHLGPEAQQAHRRYVSQQELRRLVDRNVAEARVGHETGCAALVETLAKLKVGQDPLPSGAAVVAAETEIRAAEVVAEAVGRATPTINSAWGACVSAIKWRQTLEAVEPLTSPEAKRAASWIRGKLDDGPGPAVDPIRWTLTP
jgi:hypothetical protein